MRCSEDQIFRNEDGTSFDYVFFAIAESQSANGSVYGR